MNTTHKDKKIIGWREHIALPDLGVKKIKVKVDSGARTSALHAENIEYIKKSGVNLVSFVIYPQQGSKEGAVKAEAKVLEMRWIRSSVGQQTLRPVIRTAVSLLGKVWDIEITLVNRDMMGFRMLLGREAFRRRFLLDAGVSYLGKKKSRKKTHSSSAS